MLAYTMPFLISFSLQSAFEVLLLWFICLFWLPCLFSACLKVHRNDNLGSSRCLFRLQIFLMLHPNHIFKHIRTIENECEVVCCQDFLFFLVYFKSGNSKFINNWVIWYTQRNVVGGYYEVYFIKLWKNGGWFRVYFFFFLKTTVTQWVSCQFRRHSAHNNITAMPTALCAATCAVEQKRLCINNT